MPAINDVFDKTYRDYLEQLSDIDFVEIASLLGLGASGEQIQVPLLGERYTVSSSGICKPDGERAGFSECIILSKYLLMCPREKPAESGWAPYHSFKDAQPLLNYFSREVTGPIEECFTGKLPELEAAGYALDGEIIRDAASFDLSMQFSLLPTVPVFLRFNDADEDFGAQCSVLFDQSVEACLDMESLGILGALFARKLQSHSF